MRTTKINHPEPTPARQWAVRNGIPHLAVKRDVRPVTLALVNRLRGEQAGRTGWRWRGNTASTGKKTSPPS